MLKEKEIYLERNKFLIGKRVGIAYFSRAFNWVSNTKVIEKEVFISYLKDSYILFLYEICYQLKIDITSLDFPDEIIDLSNFEHHFYPAQVSVILKEDITSILKVIYKDDCQIYVSDINLTTPVLVSISFTFKDSNAANDFFKSIV